MVSHYVVGGCSKNKIGLRVTFRSYEDQVVQQPGLVNIEFEAKVYQDIIEGENALCCIAFRGLNVPTELQNNYYFWIESIRFKPDRSFSDSDYTKWLNLYNQYDLEYNSATNDNLQRPLALRELIKNSNCY